MMQQLLYEPPQREYPGEYLASRLRGRRSSSILNQKLQRDDTITVPDSNKIREQANDERCWLFNQLNSEHRKNLAPLFLYFEVEVLVQCLRCVEAGQVEQVDTVLKKSLLAGSVKQILQENSGTEDVLLRLEHELKIIGIPVKGLAESYGAGGVQISEEMIRRALLRQVFVCTHQPDVLGFCRDLVDMRNIMILAKHLHWQLDSTPNLYDGGYIRVRIYRKNITEDELVGMVRHFVRETVVSEVVLHPVSLEELLLRSLLKKLVNSRRVSGLIPAAIEYLWQWHIAARTGKGKLSGSFPARHSQLKEAIQ